MVSMTTAMPALRAAGLIGTWSTDVAAGRSILDPGAAAMLAGDPGLADQPLPLEAALGCTHPDDRDWVFARIRRARLTGGPFSAEFRIRSATGEVRWVLNRGTLLRDVTGAMHGSGAYIDTTDSHPKRFLSAASLDREGDDPLVIAADRCLEVHAALQRTGHADLRDLTGMLLTGIGMALARRRDG
ncbi:PAS domain-containing protein [Methylobacterium sp. J-068]|uniref:PAS domain-containing protein n=1 Tax=Methylobacterium sp. J-068 TaxID=2836649 RepID=UPI001FB8C648|nr:PAS domain-containing protein [Methylobacterium sp. J-068]MCJ2037012.1 PAS domain-containing protein [Methylobacterium sp. J-068]